MANNQKFSPDIVGFVVKVLFALVFGYLIIGGMITMLDQISGAANFNDADHISFCEKDYRNKDFAGLYDHIALYDLYGEEFDEYNEAVEAYDLRCRILQWTVADRQGDENAKMYITEYQNKLQTMAENTVYPRNQRLILGFIDELGIG